ncbi:MAG: hypothetical protein ACR2MX_02865 [Cyclobacteriaceae bacterium]
METQAKLPHASVGRSYGYGWQQMKKYFLYLFLVVLILAVAEMPGGLLNFEIDDDFNPGPGFIFLQILAFIYWLLVWPVFQYGGDYLFLKAARDQKFEVKEMFKGFDKYLNVILSNLLVSAVVVMGLILLIVPGIIVACRLAFVPYLVMDRDMEAIAAVEKSWQMTRGHAWKIFGLVLLAIPIILLGLLMLFIGVIPAAMWVSTAFASLYYAVELKEQEALPESELE